MHEGDTGFSGEETNLPVAHSDTWLQQSLERWESLPFGEAVKMEDCPSSTACGPAQSQEPLPHVEELFFSVTITNKTLEVAQFERSQESLGTMLLLYMCMPEHFCKAITGL